MKLRGRCQIGSFRLKTNTTGCFIPIFRGCFGVHILRSRFSAF
jgi:hypothetical protein